MVRLSIFTAALGFSLCLTQPVVAKPVVYPERQSERLITPVTAPITASPQNQAPPENNLEESDHNNDANSDVTRFLRNQRLFSLGILLSALALAYGVYEYTRYHRWQKLEFLRQTILDFERDPEIRNALKILDFEEYRDYHFPKDHASYQGTTFRVTNDLLCKALGTHAQRVQERSALDKQLQRQGNLTEEQQQDCQAKLRDYEIATVLRDWFNKTLNGFEHFGYFIDANLYTFDEIKPWLLYWVQLIADPKNRRSGSSAFYDQLYNYINDAGFDGAKKLFERFGYKVLRSPYNNDDFDFDKRIKNINSYSNELALSLAKAAHLIYQERIYVAEIATRWGIYPKKLSPDVSIKQKLRDKNVRDYITSNFRYFDDKEHDTQAFMFQTKKCIVLAFRGSQEMRDWQTNFNCQPRPFSIRPGGGKTIISSSYKDGKVHKGFFLGWASIERKVLKQLDDWEKVRIKKGQTLLPLLVTGHSLGGALATMAAASLQENGIRIAGVYTFGQPRVGDTKFTSQFNQKLANKFFRFVNNNDVVPHLPPPWLTWNPFRIYKHAGKLKYFNAKGFFVSNYNLSMRVFDGISGVIKNFSKSTLDLIDDHSMQYYIGNLNKTLQKDNANAEDKKIEKQEADKKRV